MSAARKLATQDAPGPLLNLYNGYLEQTGSEVAAAILALDAHHRAQPLRIHRGDVTPLESQAAGTLTPPQIAKQLRVSHDKVLDWIRRGELKASNLATGGRPRYVVTPDELAAFLKRREPQQPSPRARRRGARGKGSFRMFSE
jgi:excisionase family DNA binding protein